MSSDRAESALRELLSSREGVTVELPPSFVVERCGTQQIRVKVRRPDGRPRARLLHADVVFDDEAVRTRWKNGGRSTSDARTLRIARRRGGAAVLIRHVPVLV